MKFQAFAGAYKLESSELMTLLESSPAGLTAEEAHKRLELVGPNQLREGRTRSLWRMLLEQYQNPMIVLLLVAALVAIAIGEWQDSLVILVIVLLNSLIGLIQDYRAEKALAALKQLAAPYVYVVRDGYHCRIPAAELVPGDLVELEAGNGGGR